MPKLLTVAEAATLLRLSESAVYRMLDEGSLPGFRIGPRSGGVRIDEADVLAYLESHRIGTEPPRAIPSRRVRLKHLRA
jgi:excisionase family DNA binding protein